MKYLGKINRKELQIISILFFFCLAFMNCNAKEKSIGVIAHRGFWTALKDSTQNSIAALDAALESDFYGSETDVWMTKDSVLVINHDPTIHDVVIQDSNYADIKDFKLSNGESIPTLDIFLDLLKEKSNSPTKLIIEIKALSDDQASETAKKIVEIVSRKEIEDKVEYISFWFQGVLRVKEIQPTAICSYISGRWQGERFSPLELALNGINIDYELFIYNDNLSLIQEAQELGLLTNVWTVDTYHEIYDIMMRGIDFVTTNYPDLATEIKNEIEKQSIITEIDDEQKEHYKYYDLNGSEITNPIHGKPVIRVNKREKSKLKIITLTN